MDHLVAPPSKKYRRVKDIDIPVIECKREFTLPHKFPSMIKSLPLKDQSAITIANSKLPSNLNGLKNKTVIITNDMRNLRLKTQDGKDLGEIKMQYLAKRNKINTQKITYTEQTVDRKKNNLGNIIITQANNVNRVWSSLGSQPDVGPQNHPIGSKLIVKSVTPSKSSEINRTKSPETQDKNKNVPQNYVLAKIIKVNESNETSILNKEKHRLLCNATVLSKTVTPKDDNLVMTNEKNNKNCFIKKDTFNNEEKRIINGTATEPEISKRTNVSNVKNSKTQLAKSKFPIVRCEKLAICKNKVNVNTVGASSAKTNKKKRCSNSDICSSMPGKTDELNKNVCSTKFKENKRCDVHIVNEGKNFAQKKLNDRIDDDENDVVIICEKNSISDKYSNNVQENNCISVPVNNEIVDNKYQSVHTKMSNELDPCERNNSVTPCKKITDDEKETKISKCLDVIKEALTSVKDEQLRAKALYALAECGISKAKQLPIIPPEQLKTVHDSQIQTEVFGLLDRESFVLVKEDSPTLERIKQTKHSIVCFSPITQEIQTQTEMQVQSKTKLNYSIDNMDLCSMYPPVPMLDGLDFDSDGYLIDYLNDKPNANKVKNILSTPHALCKKVAIRLEKDYEEMQHWDDNGMLNIHRAVVNDQLQEVQRLILILEASKTNIDISTDDGMTSLELAIKFNASKSIIKVLLEAGAKPISSELLHESAIILASKLSSPFLPYLLNYVTENKLLDQVDSTGFAPLHYCAFNGYLDGVNALIKVGAEVNLKDHRSGRTPFFHALENNHVLIAQRLLEIGAVADLPNYSGQTVLSLVDQTKSLSLKAALRQKVI